MKPVLMCKKPICLKGAAAAAADAAAAAAA